MPLAPDGGGALVQLYKNQLGAFAVAADGANVYWTARAFNSAPSSVSQAPIAGGGPVVPLATNQGDPVSIAVDTTSVYWADTLQSGHVWSTPIGGGAVTPIATDAYPEWLALGSGSLFYSTATANGIIGSIALDGGSSTSFTPGAPVAAIAVDALDLYMAINANFEIGSHPLDGGADALSTVTSNVNPVAIAVDTDAIYWSDSAAQTIYRLVK